MKGLGLLLLAGGIISAGYFFKGFDTSVEVPNISYSGANDWSGRRVNNLGLMADRQNGIILSVGAAIVGTLLIGFAPKPESNAKCPWCTQLIPSDSKACRYCGQPVQRRKSRDS